MTIEYPPTRKGDDIDELAGVSSPDPYRWLENDTAVEVRRWQAEQSKLASDMVRSWPGFDILRRRRRPGAVDRVHRLRMQPARH